MLAMAERSPGVDSRLLLYKVGVYGDTPLDFGPELAYDLDGICLYADSIRKMLMKVKPGKEVASRSIRQFFRETSVALLENDNNVVGDIYLNSPNTRESINRAAHEAGGIVVALNIDT